LTARIEKMGLQQKIHFESGILTVDATGEFSLEEAKQAFLEMLAAVAQYQAEKVLFDGRNLKGKPEHIERFYYGYFAAIETVKLMAKYPMRRAPRFAYLINEPLRDPRRYGETVALNLGMTVKTFETPAEAFDWLELTPPNKPEAEDI
jgi:hypothetical protein